MRILLSNDDGVLAPGLAALAQALKMIADVTVVAPESERSGFSSALTLDRPLRPLRLSNGFWSVNGTPADCVYLAVNGFFQEEPDMVISGINAGANLGDDVWYSGTVAAAMEGRFLGLPAIAVSLAGDQLRHYSTAAMVVYKIVERLQIEPLPVGTILNVNVPDVPYGELQGFEVTRLGTRHGAEPTIRQLDPRGHPVYWVGPAGAAADAGPGTDFAAILQGRVSITPIRIDLTHYEAFEQLAAWVHKL